MRINRLSIPGNVCSHCGTVVTESLQCQGCGWVDPVTESKDSYESKKGFMDGVEKKVQTEINSRQERATSTRRVVYLVILFLVPFFVWVLTQIYNILT